MVEIKDINDLFVRSVLWKAYNKRCIYCRKYLPIKNMQIDHVIPKSLGKENAIKKYGLNSDFELDSYYNLVPSCPSCNNRKRAKLYNKIQILFILNEIKSKIPKILKLEIKYKKLDIEGEISTTLSRALDEYSVYDILNILSNFSLTTTQHKALNDAIKRLKSISTLNPKENQQIQIFIDEINSILNDLLPLDKFFTIKGPRFVDYKAGIFIVNEFVGSITFSLYAVPKSETDIIREISVEQWRNLALKNKVDIRITDAKNTLLEYPRREARRHIFEYFANLISINALYRKGNDFLANEFIIDFIDYYHNSLGLEIKDVYNIPEIEYSINKYFPLWLDEVLKRIDKKLIHNMISSKGYVDIGALNTFTSASREEIRNAIISRINKKVKLSEFTTKTPLASVLFPYLVFKNHLNYFKRKNKTIIKRIYNKPDYSRKAFQKSHKVFDLYSEDVVRENLSIIYKDLPNIYNEIVNRVFPKLKDKLIPFTDFTKVIIEVEKDERAFREEPFSINEYQLEGKEKEEFEIIFFPELCKSIPNEVRKNKAKKIKFRGKTYNVYKSWHLVMDIYYSLPMFKKVHNILSNNLLNLLEKNHNDIILKII